jgi:hypothetical protein
LSRKYYEGGDSVDILALLITFTGYTIAVFSLGYILGKDIARKNK